MDATQKTRITVQTKIDIPVEKAWQVWNEPQHITQWCQASDDWHAPKAENDLREGGRLSITMAAKDGSFSFDFGGVYTKVAEDRELAYTLDDGREVSVLFERNGDRTTITETFEAEDTHPVEMQQGGWQAILDSFKRYAEKAA